MSEGDIELEDIEIVEVTGKGHRDRSHKSNKKACSCTPSLRCTTILIFVCVAVVYVAGVAVGNVLMFNSLETLDMRQSNFSINRFSMLLLDDMSKLQQMVRSYSRSDPATSSIETLVNHPEIDPEEATETFTLTYLNNTAIPGEFDDKGRQKYKYGISMEITYWAMLDTEYNTKYAVYYPKGPKDTAVVGTVKQFPAPVISPSIYASIVADMGRDSLILKMLVPNEGDDKAMIISFEPITSPSDPNSTVHGYLVGGRAVFPRMKQYSDDAPTCIAMQDGQAGAEIWDDVDREMFAQVVPGTFAPNKDYGGAAAFLKRDNATIQKTQARFCPNLPLFDATSTLMVGYFKLCGLDPVKYKENASCVLMRVDRPMSMVDQGTAPVITLSLTIIILMVVLCVIFVIFLDCVVLRRIVNLSNVIKKQTKGHADALKDEDETTATMSTQEDKPSERHGKSGKSSKSGRSPSFSSEGSYNSSEASSSSAGPAAPTSRKTARDEIENLKRAMEQNALGLRKRLEAVNDSIKIELQKTMHQKQAMQLLNLWCVRKDFFPGLRPNAMQLRYEPTRSIDDILANPLAVEYLKNHCESDRTLENLWFILDVDWLQDLETAEDNEEDEEKRSQIHDVAACAAKTIMHRYIVANAPQQVNLSAATFKRLREKGDHYTRQMFDEAVSEVKLMLTTDVLPRFQKTAAYSAMSETLFIDSSGGTDESSFSDETVSTTGSILTDAEEGEGGVSRVFAHTFKNLHTAFEMGQDENSATYSASSHATTIKGAAAPGGAAPSASVISATHTTASLAHDKSSSNDSESQSESESESEPSEKPKKEEDKPKKVEPKKEEPKKEEPKKEEPKKEESEESSESSDSSSSDSASSGSVSESSSSSASE